MYNAFQKCSISTLVDCSCIALYQHVSNYNKSVWCLRVQCNECKFNVTFILLWGQCKVWMHVASCSHSECTALLGSTAAPTLSIPFLEKNSKESKKYEDHIFASGSCVRLSPANLRSAKNTSPAPPSITSIPNWSVPAKGLKLSDILSLRS